MTTAVQLAQSVAPGVSLGFKNRIINGAMTIDQRNAGASVTPSNGVYTLDRWFWRDVTTGKATVQQSSTAPSGFSKSAVITSTSAYTPASGDVFTFCQIIEGFNFADMAWGTASAAAVTVSFWVRSSLTGTFGGVAASASSTRSYPFTYVINAANTWEQKSVTIAGDTSGTYATGNTGALELRFSLGCGSTYAGAAGSWSGSTYYSATGSTNVVGTNGATFYITGVQLEKGSTATSFEFRDYGRELIMCQRYFQAITIWSGVTSSSNVLGCFRLPVTMRANPSLALSGPNIGVTTNVQDITTTSASIDYSDTAINPPGTGGRIRIAGITGFTSGVQGAQLYNNTNYPIASAEL